MRKSLLRKVMILGIIQSFLIVSITTATDITKPSNISSSKLGDWLYVGGSGLGNYTTIQDAIDDSSDGDTIFVYDDSSPYYENLILNKQINLIGENKHTTIIDGTRNDSVIYILKDNICITGFTIRNGSRDDYRRAGIEIYSCNNHIIDNVVINNQIGVHTLFAGPLNNEGYNTFVDNHIIGNDLDAFCIHSSYNYIVHNHFEDNNGWAIALWINSIGNIIEKNNFINNFDSAVFSYSSFNRWKNNFWDDWIGLKHPLLKLCPKVIVKKIVIFDNISAVPWVNFDWHPAQEPYDIP